MFSKRDKSISMSTPEGLTKHGVKIKKLPIGKYIKLLQHAETFLPDMLIAIFPEMKEGKILTRFSEITAKDLQDVISRLAIVVPEKLCMVMGELLDIPAGELLDPDKGLTPVELIEILIELWEVNNLSNFFTNAKKLKSLIGL